MNQGRAGWAGGEGARLFGGLDVFAGPGFGRGGLMEALADLFIGFGGAVVGIE